MAVRPADPSPAVPMDPAAPAAWREGKPPPPRPAQLRSMEITLTFPCGHAVGYTNLPPGDYNLPRGIWRCPQCDPDNALVLRAAGKG
jgi:hypothetical protein